MKVSIAMATYNGGDYLQEQLQSFIFQARQPDELIITDDCSTDNTKVIVQEFQKTAPFKVEFHQNEKNLGYCGNFNAALMKTTGDIVFLSDQDDVWFPEKISYMLSLAEKNPEAQVLMNDAALTDGGLNEVGLTKMGQIKSAGLSQQAFVMGCCCAVRREFLNICLPIPAGYKAHDNWIVEIAGALNIKLVDENILQYYRRHESNESHFIANNTTRVNKRYALIVRLKAFLFSSNRYVQVLSKLEQRRIFANGVEKMALKAPQKYSKKLIELENKIRNKVTITEKHDNVRKKKFFTRFFYILFLIFRGEYFHNNGLKTLLRDVVGY